MGPHATQSLHRDGGRPVVGSRSHCRPHTLLCVATDITLPGEQIRTRSIELWKSQPVPRLNKHPSMFLLLGAS